MANNAAATTANNAAAGKKHTLYWNPICPFVHRALIVLEEKGAGGVPERVRIPLGKAKPAWYTEKINPAGTVPTLIIEGEPTLFESAFIAEYFDRVFGAPDALLPPLAPVRAAIREFQDVAQAAIRALYGVFFNKSDIPAAIAKAKAAVDELEQALAAKTAANGGPYFLGTQFSMADIHIVPFLQRFSVTLPAYRDYQPLEKAPALRRLLDAAVLRPSVFVTSQTNAEYVKGYSGYGGADFAAPKPTVRVSAGSPFGRRVTVAAAMAGVDINATVVAEADAAASGERLPSVSFVGTTARDSGKALEYLLESQRTSDAIVAEAAGAAGTPAVGAPLIPADPVQLGRAQFVAQEADTFGTAVIYSLKAAAAGNATEAAEAKKKALNGALALLEGLVAGPWSVGTAPSFADAVILPHLALLLASDPTALDGAPKLRAIFDAAQKLPNVAAALAPAAAAEVDAFVASA